MTYKTEFVEFCLQREALRFGTFVLKSGRSSPYFFNSGLFSSGEALFALAGFYGRAIEASGVEFDHLYGPAYKGIPLASALACWYAEHRGRSIPFCFNRKETKDHGEGGGHGGRAVAGQSFNRR